MTQDSRLKTQDPPSADPKVPFRYTSALAKEIEPRWQTRWEQEQTFRTPNPGDADFDASRPKFYVLDMFPYPSGVGLHVGHPLGYIATDILARYKRLQGCNVLHPMGFDAFGLPAEQFAVEHGVHPAVTTQKNIGNMVRQLKSLGLGYDWGRELATIDKGYYRWTQWIFLQMYGSWFDRETNRARPVAELISELDNGGRHVGVDGHVVSTPVDGVTPWSQMSEAEKNTFVDGRRLAYIDEVAVNWCPALGTVLANEEVTNEGRSERGNHPVFKRPLRQWMLRITEYAERLSDDLEMVDWPEPIKLMQRNWIGRSEGAMIDFPVNGVDETLRVFTTRPDTVFGATYMVLAPEHPLVERITTPDHRGDVDAYRQRAERMSDIDRMSDTKEKTGVATGGFATNPANGQPIPIWIADYVLMGYGTGAIMAVPAHDTRDGEFARAFDLPIIEVVQPTAPGDEPSSETHAFCGQGKNVNSAGDGVSLDGLETPEAKRRIIEWLDSTGRGNAQVQYKLRDWLFSRQRYWGEPFPMLHDPDGNIVPVDESDLPVALPEMEDFSPTASDDPDAPPRPPLSRAPESWRVVERDGVRYTRELNTMPQWAGSCWYYLRFLDPHNEDRFVSAEAEKYWMGEHGIDLYVGGAEHAVLHLLYARFWHKVLFDLGHVHTPEPFGRLYNQGYIQAYAYRDERGIVVDAMSVVDQDGRPAHEVQDQKDREYQLEGEPVTQEYGKMGKSLRNAVGPDEIVTQYGCDTLRLYEMYMGPLDASKPWNPRDIAGPFRFLQRVWRLAVDETTGELHLCDEASQDVERHLHRMIDRVYQDIERMAFNTAIAAMIEFVNEVTGSVLTKDQLERFAIVLGPFAPHVAEELWHRLGHETSVALEAWPAVDEAMLSDDTIEMPVQIAGKVRAKLTVPADADKDQIEKAALADPRVIEQLEGKTLRKVIVVPGKIVNIVAG